jgi:putative FmdB family regulatory protein
MPFYEYECQACKFYTEVMQKISDPPLSKCPSCGKRRLRKLVSAPVFRLKGSGWYETDFKSDKESKRNLLGAEKEEAKTEGKAEAKDGKAAAPDAKTAEAKPAEAKGTEGKGEAKPAARARRAPARKAQRAPRRSGRRARR